MNDYTNRFKTHFDSDDDVTPEEVLAYLNEPSTFRSFGNGLKYIMKKRYPDAQNEIETAPDAFLRKCCKTNGVPEAAIGSYNTISNWFRKEGGVKEGGPKNGDANRIRNFTIAFALNLDMTLTKELFHKVYWDRAFNVRMPNELVYYYCIQKGRSWTEACELIAQIPSILENLENASKNSQTVPTTAIEQAIIDSQSDRQLLNYVAAQQYNLCKNDAVGKYNVRAKTILDDLKMKAMKIAKGEAEITGTQIKRYDRTDSYAFVYSMIVDMPSSGENGSITLFGKNARIRESIKHSFPEVHSLTASDLDYEKMRKLIILLFSYIAWFKACWSIKRGRNEKITDYKRNEPPQINVDTYESDLSEKLLAAGLPPLYWGNPYDLLFLYCTKFGANPLDFFREIISDILTEE